MLNNVFFSSKFRNENLNKKLRFKFYDIKQYNKQKKYLKVEMSN